MVVTEMIESCPEACTQLCRLIEAQSKNTTDIFIYNEGGIKQIEPNDFKNRFGVRYAMHLQLDHKLPQEFFEDMYGYGNVVFSEDSEYYKETSAKQRAHRIERVLREGDWDNLTDTEVRYLYEDQILEGKTAPVYVGKVSEVTGKKNLDSAGCGLFAREDIVKGQFIGEATGKIERVECDGNWEPSYAYKYRDECPDFAEILNCLETANSLRFMNHSKKSKVISKMVYCNDLYHLIWISAIDIRQGDQILSNYGDAYWKGMGVEPLKFD